MLSILRRPEVERRFGKPRSTMYAEQAAGLFPKPIALGARSVGWIESEVVTVLAARAAALADEQVRALVADLLAHRANGSGGATAETGAALVRELSRWNLRTPARDDDTAKGRPLTKRGASVHAKAGAPC